jgi:hypothetical protein
MYVCWLVFEVIFLFFTIVETKNLSLEETAVIFDGETAIERIAAKAAHEISDNPTEVKEEMDEKGSDSYTPAKLRA